MEKRMPVVLIADADTTATRGLRVALRRGGAQVVMADSLVQAIEMAVRHHPDVIVLDDDLDAGQGVDLAGYFANAYPDAGIVLLSSKPSGTPRGFGLGLLYSGQKPVSTETLYDVIRTSLEGRLRDSSMGGREPKRVLCVDDDLPYLRSLARALAQHGYRVFPFGSGAQALASVQEVKPDLAVVDIMMPGLDGLDLTERICERFKDRFPVILLSALSGEEAYYRGCERGASYYLCKDQETKKLLDVVDYYGGDLDREEREVLQTQI